MIRFIVYTLAIVGLFILQHSFISHLPFLGHLNLVIVVFTFLILITQPLNALYVAILIGLLYDVFSFFPLGASIGLFALTWFITELFHRKVFSDFSFYSNVILVVIATVIYQVGSVLLAQLLVLLGIMSIAPQYDMSWLTGSGAEIVANMIAAGLLFIIVARVSRVLNLAFIKKA